MNKKKNEEGETFVYRDVKWLRYTKENINKVLYKTSLDENIPFKTLNMTRRNSNLINIPVAYSESLPITEEKKSDLLSLMSFIPDVFHYFYKNLKTSKDISDPLISESENDN